MWDRGLSCLVPVGVASAPRLKTYMKCLICELNNYRVNLENNKLKGVLRLGVLFVSFLV